MLGPKRRHWVQDDQVFFHGSKQRQFPKVGRISTKLREQKSQSQLDLQRLLQHFEALNPNRDDMSQLDHSINQEAAYRFLKEVNPSSFEKFQSGGDKLIDDLDEISEIQNDENPSRLSFEVKCFGTNQLPAEPI